MSQTTAAPAAPAEPAVEPEVREPETPDETQDGTEPAAREITKERKRLEFVLSLEAQFLTDTDLGRLIDNLRARPGRRDRPVYDARPDESKPDDDRVPIAAWNEIDEALRQLRAAKEVMPPDSEDPVEGCTAVIVERAIDNAIDKLAPLVGRESSLTVATDTESANGLPKWSVPDWPEFQRAVALLPGFPKHSGYETMVGVMQDGLSEAMLNRETEDDWMMHRAQYVAEHCVPQVRP